MRHALSRSHVDSSELGQDVAKQMPPNGNATTCSRLMLDRKAEHVNRLFIPTAFEFKLLMPEHIQRAVHDSGFPRWLWNGMAASYTAPRCIRWQRRLGLLGKTAGTVVPGCALAAVAVKILMLPLLKHLQELSPEASITSVVDDLGLQLEGTVSQVLEGLLHIARYTLDWLNAAGLPLSVRKSFLLASCAKLRERLLTAIDHPHIVPVASA
eukprot:4659338-Amphidinium_carterae.1